MNPGVLLLAAGGSTRYGADKRYARLAGGATVLETCVRAITGSGLPLLVCLPQGDERTAARMRQAGVRCHHCADASQGMGATLAEGIRQVGDWPAVLVALADMPWVSSQLFVQVAGLLSEDTICVPRFRGRRGHPVGFGRRFYPELAQLQGDQGARGLLDRHAASVRFLDVADEGVLRDIDRPQDLG